MAAQRYTSWQAQGSKKSIGQGVWRRAGFTLIELMVAVLIVGILAAAALSILRGRVDSAKWSEGKAMLGTIGVAIRAYAGVHPGGPNPTTPDIFAPTRLGFGNGDLTGHFFADADFSIEACDVTTTPLTFRIRCDAGTGTDPPIAPSAYTLDQSGNFVAVP